MPLITLVIVINFASRFRSYLHTFILCFVYKVLYVPEKLEHSSESDGNPEKGDGVTAKAPVTEQDLIAAVLGSSAAPASASESRDRLEESSSECDKENNTSSSTCGSQSTSSQVQHGAVKQLSVPEPSRNAKSPSKEQLCMTRSIPGDCSSFLRRNQSAKTPPPSPSNQSSHNRANSSYGRPSSRESLSPSPVEKRLSPQGESRREQMLKRLSYPVESLTSVSKSVGKSAANMTKTAAHKVLSTPKNVAEFSGGLIKDARDALTTSGSKSDSLEGDVDAFSRLSHSPNKSTSSSEDNRRSWFGTTFDSKGDVFEVVSMNDGAPFEELVEPPLPELNGNY